MCYSPATFVLFPGLHVKHRYCHAGLTSDHFVTAPLPSDSSSSPSSQYDLSFAHALPVPASSSEAKHSGRFACKAHEVDRMQASACSLQLGGDAPGSA